MKVKCIRLLNADGEEVESSSWLTLGHVYHVMGIYVAPDGRRSFRIISRNPEREWPQMGYQNAQCFEVISEKVPSNWREWGNKSACGIGPEAWQTPGFLEAFYDHDPATYPIFERERDIILREDP
jgi:hypothetical protein